jgi:hypothetical protein
MNENVMRSNMHELISQLHINGLVQMGPLGDWEVTRKGRDLLDRLDVLRELDGGRPGAPQGSSPWRQAPPAQAPEPLSSTDRRRPGDDVRPARGRRAKTTPKPTPQK